MNENALSIHFEFAKHSSQPTRVFQSVQKIIQAVEAADVLFLGGFQSEIKPELFLEDVKDGSLLVLIARGLNWPLELVPPETLASGDWKKGVGHFLVRANRRLTQFIHNREMVSSLGELQNLGSEIQTLAEEAKMPLLPMYHPPTSRELLQVLQIYGQSMEPLKEGDRVMIGTPGENEDVELCPTFRVTDADFDRLLVREEITAPAPTEMILKVRRPDFFGSSQWEFKWNGQVFKAKVCDSAWLCEFLSKRTALTPGDGLRVLVVSTVAYGWDNEVVHQHHSIQKVLEVIPGEIAIQERLPVE